MQPSFEVHSLWLTRRAWRKQWQDAFAYVCMCAMPCQAPTRSLGFARRENILDAQDPHNKLVQLDSIDLDGRYIPRVLPWLFLCNPLGSHRVVGIVLVT